MKTILALVAFMVLITSVNASPVINSVVLNTTTPEKGASILVTVNVTSDIEVTNVTANDIELVNQSTNIWNGTITALAGTHVVRVVAKDISGNITRNNSVRYFTDKDAKTENEHKIDATIIVKPNRLNLVSNGKFTIFIILPKDVHAKNINLDTIEIQGVPAVKGISSKRNGGTLILKFDRENFMDIMGDPQTTTVTVTGFLNDGTYFEGSETLNNVKVIDILKTIDNHKDKKGENGKDKDEIKEKGHDKDDYKGDDNGNKNNGANNNANSNGNRNRKESRGDDKSKNE